MMLTQPKKKIATLIVAGMGKKKPESEKEPSMEEPENDDSYAVEAVMEDFIKAVKEGSAKAAASHFKDLVGMCSHSSSYDEE